jgi:tRNA-specific 2-thiouridylase
MIESETGKVMGNHEGFWFYTIGQRQGLGLGGGPWYVVAKDCDKNIIYISRNYYDGEKQRDSFAVKEIHWLSGKPSQETNLLVKLRHGPQKYSCTVNYDEKDKVFVTISERDQGIAAGQYAVFYDGDVCLGSGVILTQYLNPTLHFVSHGDPNQDKS